MIFGGTYKMVTLPQHDVYYKKMMTTSGRKLSKSALETLAIVAYYQPVTRIRIEEIRGVGCESMIRKLLAQALIKEVGRDDSQVNQSYMVLLMNSWMLLI